LKIKQELETMLPNFLNLWYPASLDMDYGGYYVDFAYNWVNTGPNDKFLYTQARLLWTASRVAAIYPDPRYLQAADHGFAYFRDVMWDKEYSGFYTLLYRNGTIPTTGYRDEKRLYGNSFAIFGLAAYYNLTKNVEALELAKKTFLWLDAHAHDNTYGGYYQYLLRSGVPYNDNYPSLAPDLPQRLADFKDYNSGIHLLEALTALYRVWPDSLLQERLLENLHIIRDTMTNQKGELRLYFYPNWTPFKYTSDKEAEDDNFLLEFVSWGHNIETAFLLLDASNSLGNVEYQETLQKSKIMVDSSIGEIGYDLNVGGICYEGYYFAVNNSLTVIDNEKQWWVQAECLHSALLIYTLFPDEIKYKTVVIQQWNYINQYIIDPIYGGWYRDGLDKTPSAKLAPKGDPWKANYHDSRAMMDCIKLIN